MSNVKKFAKFGIVLVAAITVATAAQSQGVVTHHVYAEEVTNDSNYNNYRMFYVHSADYPNDPNDGGMAGRVIKPDDPYVVNENFREPGTYSHYDVFDGDGKHYNVGDTITVDDPLVNHPNEEDNNLYYYYYPLTPSTSETPTPAPAPSVSPSTSESPNTSTSPSTSEAPAVEKPSQKTDDKTTATEKAKADKKADSKKASDKVKAEKSKDTTSEKTVAAKDNSTSKTAEASAPAEQAKATVKANANVNPSENSQAIVKQADGTVDTAAVHNDNTGFLLTMLGFVSAAFVVFIALFKTKKEEK